MRMCCPNCKDAFEVTRDMYDGHFECSKCGFVFKVPFPVASQVQKKAVQNVDDANKVEVTDFTIGWLETLCLCIKFIICFSFASLIVGALGFLFFLIFVSAQRGQF